MAGQQAGRAVSMVSDYTLARYSQPPQCASIAFWVTYLAHTAVDALIAGATASSARITGSAEIAAHRLSLTPVRQI
tara:strand:+ start:154 stop:381 length:228 start_codon:yes stop_codon:yes gene_type:complete